MQTDRPTSAYRLAALTLGLATTGRAPRASACRRLRAAAEPGIADAARAVLERLRATDPRAAGRALELLDAAFPERVIDVATTIDREVTA